MKNLMNTAFLTFFSGLTAILAVFLPPSPVVAEDLYSPKDTQPGIAAPPTADEALRVLKLPAGFTATVFAAEPMVRQPVDMKVDDRGRLWVCECYSYQDWKRSGEDRILILEDVDRDGKMDKRKIFPARFSHLSSVEIGHRGIWVLDSPTLLFFPDIDQNDEPDGPPITILDGWTTEAEHNMANGLQWGPDGWLYGRHGITAPSKVGPPGTPETDRAFVEPGIWRLHPQTKQFEMVVRGMTNPWGLDWDQNYELYASGNVNGHLWHCVEGSLFERMFGSGSVPHDYERLKSIPERPHYPSSGDWKQDWSSKEKGRDAASDLGGGHSHCGLLIYQGDNWPEAMRGKAYMCNTHGRRINAEEIIPVGDRKSLSPMSKHVGDPFTFQTSWFRGVSLVPAADGSVFLSDWCDDGECHDHDGVHRSSGRIYQIWHGERKLPALAEKLATATTAELFATATSSNEWLFRKAVRLLAERPASKNADTMIAWDQLQTPQHKIRALYLAKAAGRVELIPKDLLNAEHDAVAKHTRLILGDSPTLPLAESSRLVALRAAMLRKADNLDPAAWAAVFEMTAQLSADPRLTLVVWHNLEPLVERAGNSLLLATPRIPETLVEFLTRRLSHTVHLNELPATINQLGNPDLQKRALQGLKEGLSGRKVAIPSSWVAASKTLQLAHSEAIDELAVLLGDPTAEEIFRKRVTNSTVLAERVFALKMLARGRSDTSRSTLQQALQDTALRPTALALAEILPTEALQNAVEPILPQLTVEERRAALEAMITRSQGATRVLYWLEKGILSRSELGLHHARQIQAHQNATLDASLERLWGKVSTNRADHEADIAKFRTMVETGPKGDTVAGKLVYTAACGACHTLFGEGGALGPDLTGTGRKDLNYLLLNVINPSLAVPRDYQMQVVSLKDGQVLSGVVPQETDTTLTLQTLTEKRVLPKSEVQSVQKLGLSWMPEGLLQQRTEKEVRDLMAYLRQ